MPFFISTTIPHLSWSHSFCPRRMHLAWCVCHCLIPPTRIPTSPVSDALQPAANLASPLCSWGYLCVLPPLGFGFSMGRHGRLPSKGLGKCRIGTLVGEKLDANGKSEGAEGRLVSLDDPLPVNQHMDGWKRILACRRVLSSFSSLRSHGLIYAFSSSTYPSIHDNVRTVAICAGSGGSMLIGRNAEVYCTGKMYHVRIYPICIDIVLIPRS